MQSSTDSFLEKSRCWSPAISRKLFAQRRTKPDPLVPFARSKISSVTPTKQLSKPRATKLAVLPKSWASAAKPSSRSAKNTNCSSRSSPSQLVILLALRNEGSAAKDLSVKCWARSTHETPPPHARKNPPRRGSHAHRCIHCTHPPLC